MATPTAAQETRIASDFEIAQMKAQIAKSRHFLAQLSGHLNLGDLYATRNERTTAAEEYKRALALAIEERVDARRASDMTRYSTASSYAGLAQAKLGRAGEAFALLEESIRYSADSAKSWNLYSSAMSLLGKTAKAASAARNAVTIATRDVERTPSVTNRLDLAIHQYSLASATDDERLLRTVVDSLRSPAFDSLRRDVARHESFEIYSTARGEPAAYLSLLNRAQLRLASLLEKRGDLAGARAVYERVLETRTDDASALAALARLAPAGRERFFAAAFDANPFSLALIREYQRYLSAAEDSGAPLDDSTTGGKVRRALVAMRRGETHTARNILDALLAQFPNNDTLRALRNESAPRLLADEDRKALDTKILTGTAIFNGTDFYSGTIDGVLFRFAQPAVFHGKFPSGVPLRLTYRVLGVTELNGADALLLEPIRLEVIK